jgi:uncharacterized membrane protein YphA (DoxX/SURF4 family)
MSKTLWIWARILYSVPLFITGILYLWKPEDTVETLTSFIPGGLNLIYGAGALWVIFGLMIAGNIKIRFAAWGAIVLLVAYQVMVHIPGVYTGEYLAIVWFELLRDLSLMGGAFFILAASDALEEEGFLEEEEESEEWRVSIH